MDAQFRAWHLTPAEREVALLLLKGYSSRAELAAYFLEDLLLPTDEREVVPLGGEPDRD